MRRGELAMGKRLRSAVSYDLLGNGLRESARCAERGSDERRRGSAQRKTARRSGHVATRTDVTIGNRVETRSGSRWSEIRPARQGREARFGRPVIARSATLGRCGVKRFEEVGAKGRG